MNTDQRIAHAWAAGLYEGEGSCGKDTRGYPRLVVGMTDRDILERFRDVLGVGCIYEQGRDPRYKRYFIYQTSGWRGVRWFRDTMAPWLGPRRLAQLDRALEGEPPERSVAKVPCSEPSSAGYRRHLRRGELPCGPCREANTEYERARRGSRKRYPDGQGYVRFQRAPAT